MQAVAEEFYGSDAQINVLRRGRALFDILHGDGRFSCHGRVTGVVSPAFGDMNLIARLCEVQGASHYACIGENDVATVLQAAEAAGLQSTHYARWEVDAAAATAAAPSNVPDNLTIARLSPQTAPKTLASFAQMSLACGVLPAWRSAHIGQSLRARTLVAVTPGGEVVSSAYAASYITDGSELARRECFWGMLATAPAWRGRRLSLALGTRLMQEMRDDFGFTSFYTGVEAGNAPSEAICARAGLRKTGNSIVTFADTAQLPAAYDKVAASPLPCHDPKAMLPPMKQIPKAPLILGLAGLIPFVWGAATYLSEPLSAWGLRALGPRFVGPYVQLFYGSVILSFMSGVLWGFATKASGTRAATGYVLSVIPALWAFFMTGGGPTTAGMNLIFGFLGLLILDFAFALWGLTPKWWMSLRLLLTAIVVICLCIGVFL